MYFASCKNQLTKPTLRALEYTHNRCIKSPSIRFGTPWAPSAGSAEKIKVNLGAGKVGRAIYETDFRGNSSVGDMHVPFLQYVETPFRH
jgi:hypothetical protein